MPLELPTEVWYRVQETHYAAEICAFEAGVKAARVALRESSSE